MRQYIIISMILFFIGIAIKGHTQSVLGSPRTWVSASYVNLYDATSETATFTILTDAGEIKLLHAGRSRAFEIVSTSGSWNNIEEDGMLVCTVESGSASGTVTLTCSGGDYSITVDFSAHAQGMKRRFLTSTPTLTP